MPRGVYNRNKPQVPKGMRYCEVCKTIKPLSSFYSYQATRNGERVKCYRAKCKGCYWHNGRDRTKEMAEHRKKQKEQREKEKEIMTMRWV